MQSEARQRGQPCARGNPNHVFGMRYRDDGSFQAHAGQAGAMPILLPKAGRENTGG